MNVVACAQGSIDLLLGAGVKLALFPGLAVAGLIGSLQLGVPFGAGQHDEEVDVDGLVQGVLEKDLVLPLSLGQLPHVGHIGGAVAVVVDQQGVDVGDDGGILVLLLDDILHGLGEVGESQAFVQQVGLQVGAVLGQAHVSGILNTGADGVGQDGVVGNYEIDYIIDLLKMMNQLH